MIHNIPLVLLGDDGTILNAIESQRGRVSVARSAHTFADALGYAHAGIACAILSVGLPQEATVSILHELDEADVKFIALVPEDTLLPDLVMPLATDTEPHQLPAIVEKLLDEASAEPEQELGITPQEAENGYGYDSGYSGHYGYDTQNLYNGSGEYLHPDTSGYGYALVNPDRNQTEQNSIDFSLPRLPQAQLEVPQLQEAYKASVHLENMQQLTLNDFRDQSRQHHPQFSGPHIDAVEAENRGTIVAVWGTGGAPGRSTLALNLANCAAAEGMRVCLVDADTYDPSLSPLLGLLDDYSGIAQLCHFAERGQLDTQISDEAISTLRVGKYYLDFLSGITRPDRWPELRTRALCDSLKWLAHRYDVIILDTAACLESDAELGFAQSGPRRNGAAITALEMADHIVLLGNADIIGIPRTIRAYDQMREGACTLRDTAKVHIWLNKVRAEATGRDAERELANTWQRFGPRSPISGFLPYDRKTVDRAWFRGQTLLEYAPRSPLVVGIRTLYVSLSLRKLR